MVYSTRGTYQMELENTLQSPSHVSPWRWLKSATANAQTIIRDVIGSCRKLVAESPLFHMFLYISITFLKFAINVATLGRNSVLNEPTFYSIFVATLIQGITKPSSSSEVAVAFDLAESSRHDPPFTGEPSAHVDALREAAH